MASGIIYYVVTNSDLDEGRGHSVIRAVFDDEDSAVNYGKNKDAGGRPAAIYKGKLNEAVSYDKDNLVFGYIKGPTGYFRYGYADGRDLPQDDPEWEEYIRLHAKFKGQ